MKFNIWNLSMGFLAMNITAIALYGRSSTQINEASKKQELRSAREEF